MSRFVFAGLLLTLLAASNALALDPCTDRQIVDAFLIYVDPVTFAAAPNQQVFGDRLRFAVESNIRELRQQVLSDRARMRNMPEIVVIPCAPARAPHQSSDFNGNELQTLQDSRVVLELWGLVLDDLHGKGQLGYVLVSATKARVANPAIYTLDQTLGRDPISIQKVFSKNPELQAYATIAVGTRLFQNSQFVQAAGYLCSGAVKLDKAIADRQRFHSDPFFITQQKSLLAGTLDLRKQALAKMSPGAISDACPVETKP